MNRVLALIVATALLCVQAGAGQASPPPKTAPLPKDPVFASGQVWQVIWMDGSSHTLTVPKLTSLERGMFKYVSASRRADTGALRGVQFWYDPVDADPEFISVTIADLAAKTTLACLYRTPGQVRLNQPLRGLQSDNTAADFARAVTYVTEGELNGQTCTLKRLN